MGRQTRLLFLFQKMGPYLMLTALMVFLPSQVSSQPGVYFASRNEMYATYSNWLVTFSHDLEPYEEHVEALKQEVNNFEELVLQLLRKDETESVPMTDHHSRVKSIRKDILTLMRKESVQFQQEYGKLQILFENLSGLASKESKSRQKRALLPIFGSLLSNLFGVATNGQLKQIRRTINTLAESQESIVHAVQDGLTLINKTHEVARENRKIINDIINATDTLAWKCAMLYEEVKGVIEPEITYTQLVTMIHDVYHVVNAALTEAHFALSELCNQVSQATHGSLAMSMVSPVKLKKVLRDIKKQLPSDMSTAFPLTPSGLSKYYKYLPALLIPDNNRFHVLVAIPIVNEDAYFDLYEIISLPTPRATISLSAKYVLESKYIAVAKDRKRYVLMSDLEAVACQQLPYCKLKSPIYNVDRAPSCVMSLFHQRPDKVNSYCKRELVRTPVAPIVQHIFDGNWAISHQSDLEVYIECINNDGSKIPEKYTVVVRNGTGVIKLDNGCKARSKYFEITPYMHKELDVDIQVSFDNDLSGMNSLPSAWNGTEGVIDQIQANKGTELTLLPMQAVDNLPFVEMQTLLHNSLKGIEKAKSSNQVKGSQVLTILVVVVTIVLMLAGGILAVVGYRKVKRARHEFKTYYRAPHSIELVETRADLTDAGLATCQKGEDDDTQVTPKTAGTVTLVTHSGPVLNG